MICNPKGYQQRLSFSLFWVNLTIIAMETIALLHFVSFLSSLHPFLPIQGQKLNIFRGSPQISSPEEGEKKVHALQILIFQKRMYTFLFKFHVVWNYGWPLWHPMYFNFIIIFSLCVIIYEPCASYYSEEVRSWDLNHLKCKLLIKQLIPALPLATQINCTGWIKRTTFTISVGMSYY